MHYNAQLHKHAEPHGAGVLVPVSVGAPRALRAAAATGIATGLSSASVSSAAFAVPGAESLVGKPLPRRLTGLTDTPARLRALVAAASAGAGASHGHADGAHVHDGAADKGGEGAHEHEHEHESGGSGSGGTAGGDPHAGHGHGENHWHIGAALALGFAFQLVVDRLAGGLGHGHGGGVTPPPSASAVVPHEAGGGGAGTGQAAAGDSGGSSGGAPDGNVLERGAGQDDAKSRSAMVSRGSEALWRLCCVLCSAVEAVLTRGMSPLLPSPQVGLVVHAMVDGVALGAAVQEGDAALGMLVFVAIMLHKAPSVRGPPALAACNCRRCHPGSPPLSPPHSPLPGLWSRFVSPPPRHLSRGGAPPHAHLLLCRTPRRPLHIRAPRSRPL
jgi:hypothetical protein